MKYLLNNGDEMLACPGLSVGDIISIPITIRPCRVMRWLGKKERSVFREFKITDVVTS